MRVKIDASLSYEFPEPVDVLLAIEALPLPDQTIVSEKLDVSGQATLSQVEGWNKLGRRRWMHAEGEIRMVYQAIVDVVRPAMSLQGLQVPPRRELPADVIEFLFPSRYCESDKLDTFAMRTFGGTRGGDQVAMMSGWIYDHFEYKHGTSTCDTTAADTFMTREGVCRDYAHVLISFCRAVGVPARMVSVYAPNLQPPDFHAVVEVWLEGAWHLVDPTRLAQEDGLVRIVSGRDATDISFMTIFGSAELIEQSVQVTFAETVEA
ncbi:MAG: transglutaminase family protein [Henriciella sp.]|uniref:transglutaminase-like domain-containing protein n=1 Tax=Henriciella sp. TaxID=1968823 RepID=UPI003C77E37C